MLSVVSLSPFSTENMSLLTTTRKHQADMLAAVQAEIDECDKQIEETLEQFKTLRGGRSCFPFLGAEITAGLVDDVFDELRQNYGECNGKLDVIIDSPGGDIDAAYNLAQLFRKYGYDELVFVVPRWAKSAATLIVCAGDRIDMTPVAELGPVDPQITELRAYEGRLEQFSPLDISSTMDLIRTEFETGSERLAQGLLERLQFPLTLGSFLKLLQVGEQYLVKLLETRMLKDDPSNVKAIAQGLGNSFAGHGFCINLEEAKSLGLNVRELDGDELGAVWNIHRQHQLKQIKQRELRRLEVTESVKNLPPEILERLNDEDAKQGKRGNGQPE